MGMKRRLSWMVITVYLLLAGSAAANAAILRTMKASSDVDAGMIVSLNKTAGSVDATVNSTVSDIYGVVTAKQSSGQVNVAIDGTVPVMVGDFNGDVKSGDAITSSVLAGVGEKATTQAAIVGVAASDLSASKDTVSKTITDESGKPAKVKLGMILVSIKVGSIGSSVPAGLTGQVDVIAGKHVSVLRISISLIIVLAVVLIVTVMIYTSVRGSIVAIGRNPLVRGDVIKSLVRILLVALAFVAFAAVSIFVLIKF